MPFRSTDCSKRTSTFFETNHSNALLEAFGLINSSNLDPLWTKVTFFSGKSAAISPASSTPVGPPPTIKIEFAALILSFSGNKNYKSVDSVLKQAEVQYATFLLIYMEYKTDLKARDN